MLRTSGSDNLTVNGTTCLSDIFVNGNPAVIAASGTINQLVYDYRDDYDLAAGGTFSGAARSVKGRGQIDALASVNITPHVTVALDAFNLTEELREEYQSVALIPRRADSTGARSSSVCARTFDQA